MALGQSAYWLQPTNRVDLLMLSVHFCSNQMLPQKQINIIKLWRHDPFSVWDVILRVEVLVMSKTLACF